MKTKASLVAESVRLKQWSQQIRECQNRPACILGHKIVSAKYQGVPNTFAPTPVTDVRVVSILL